MTTTKTTVNLLKFQNYMARLGYELNVARTNINGSSEIELSFMPKDNDVKNLSSILRYIDDTGLIDLINSVLKNYELTYFICYGRKKFLWVQDYKSVNSKMKMKQTDK